MESSSLQRFDGKVALVTGAASGIGRATALRLAEEGARVVAVDRDEGGNQAVVADLLDSGHTAVAATCDLLDTGSIAPTVDAAAGEWGRLDVVCNIAGIGHFARDEVETLEAWNQVIAVNLTGTYLVSQAALPHLLAGEGGAIVNTSSSSATAGAPWSSAYSASKGGVIALTQTMAVTHGKQRLRVNCIAPGGVETPIVEQFSFPDGVEMDRALLGRIMPFDRMGEPEELAAAFAFLASDDASYCNGIVLRVDGGLQA